MLLNSCSNKLIRALMCILQIDSISALLYKTGLLHIWEAEEAVVCFDILEIKLYEH